MNETPDFLSLAVVLLLIGGWVAVAVLATLLAMLKGFLRDQDAEEDADQAEALRRWRDEP